MVYNPRIYHIDIGNPERSRGCLCTTIEWELDDVQSTAARSVTTAGTCTSCRQTIVRRTTDSGGDERFQLLAASVS